MFALVSLDPDMYIFLGCYRQMGEVDFFAKRHSQKQKHPIAIYNFNHRFPIDWSRKTPIYGWFEGKRIFDFYAIIERINASKECIYLLNKDMSACFRFMNLFDVPWQILAETDWIETVKLYKLLNNCSLSEAAAKTKEHLNKKGL